MSKKELSGEVIKDQNDKTISIDENNRQIKKKVDIISNNQLLKNWLNGTNQQADDEAENLYKQETHAISLGFGSKNINPGYRGGKKKLTNKKLVRSQKKRKLKKNKTLRKRAIRK